MTEKIPELGGEYKYGFKDDIKPIYTTGEGLTEEIVRKISEAKNEPEWRHIKIFQCLILARI